MSYLVTFPDVSTSVLCGGREHRITWSSGALSAIDHDVDVERALVSWGGEPPLCVELIDAWIAAHGVPGIVGHLLTLIDDSSPAGTPTTRSVRIVDLTRSFGMLSAALAALVPTVRALGVRGQLNATTSAAMRIRAAHREMLTALPLDLRMRLVASIIDSIEADWPDDGSTMPGPPDDFMFLVTMCDRIRDSLRQSLGAWTPVGGTVRVSMRAEVKLVAPPARASLTASAWGDTVVVDVQASPAWLGNVWTRGAAIVDGCFVLEVLHAEAGLERLVVRAVRWERARRWTFLPVVCDAELNRNAAGVWTLAWL